MSLRVQLLKTVGCNWCFLCMNNYYLLFSYKTETINWYFVNICSCNDMIISLSLVTYHHHIEVTLLCYERKLRTLGFHKNSYSILSCQHCCSTTNHVHLSWCSLWVYSFLESVPFVFILSPVATLCLTSAVMQIKCVQLV